VAQRGMAWHSVSYVQCPGILMSYCCVSERDGKENVIEGKGREGRGVGFFFFFFFF